MFEESSSFVCIQCGIKLVHFARKSERVSERSYGRSSERSTMWYQVRIHGGQGGHAHRQEGGAGEGQSGPAAGEGGGMFNVH